MEEKKIIISTTFREFRGNDNDKMQLQFLKSLKRQTYQNFILVVTIYQEVNVEKVIKQQFPENSVFVQTKLQNCRYSLSEVFRNGVDYGLENNLPIILDCSSDITLQDNFLETIINCYSRGFAAISHPNIFLEVDEKFHVVNKQYGRICRGIDVRIFDIDIFRNKKAYRILKKYELYDWGVIEHLTCAIAQKYAIDKINFFTLSKVYKIENDREASGDTSDFMKRSVKINHATFRRFINNEKMSLRLFSLFYIHNIFRIIGDKRRFYLRFGKEYLVAACKDFFAYHRM